MPFEKPVTKAVAFLLFVLVFGSVIATGRMFGLELNKESSFATLTALLSAGLACALTLAGQRILFGQRRTRPLSMGLKIILLVTIPASLALAIWDGIDARQREEAVSRLRPPSPIQQLQAANFQDLSNAVQQAQALDRGKQGGLSEPAPSSGANP